MPRHQFMFKKGDPGNGVSWRCNYKLHQKVEELKHETLDGKDVYLNQDEVASVLVSEVRNNPEYHTLGELFAIWVEMKEEDELIYKYD